MKDQSSSEPLEEKPTYQIQVEAEKFADSQFTIPYEKLDELNHAKYTGIMIGYNCAASKANARTAELEKAIRLLLTELKALREERDKFAIGFSKYSNYAGISNESRLELLEEFKSTKQK